MSENKKNSRAFHAVVVLWVGLLTACVASPEEPEEATLLQPVMGEQTYTAQSQGYDDLLLHRTGFALSANVIGAGPDAHVYIVDKTSDDGSEGTLRHALMSPQKYWIRFAPALAGQSITVKSSILVESYKTIDGRMSYAQPVRIKTDASETHSVMAFVFTKKTQLIVMNLNFDDGYDGWKSDAERSEAIHITESKHIWLHQNRFARFRDTVVEMDNPLSDYITLSYNLFERQYQAVVLSSWHADFHHNRCLNSGARCPKLIGPATGGASVYVYNNLIEFWSRDTIHNLSEPGNYLAVGNVYNPRTDALRESGACGESPGSPDSWKSDQNGKVGALEGSGCLEIRTPHVEHTVAPVMFLSSSCTANPAIPASVNLEPASDALAISLRMNARPQAYVVNDTCR